MYQVSEAFPEALKDYENKHHIKATISQIDGTVYTLQDDELDGSPRYDKQCVENPEVFNFGEMYVGTAEVTVQMPGVLSNRFRGGELRLEFGVDISENEIEWIPLGVWDITDPKRETGDRIILQCSDRMNRLQVRCDDNSTGVIFLQNVLNFVSEKAGVEFAQTAGEIAEMINESANMLYKISFAETCWDEVRMISQLVGGFAFANREGKIEFRKFSSVPYTIPAEKRFGLSLNEYVFGTQSVSYTDRHGMTYTTGSFQREVGAKLSFSENGYIPSVEYKMNTDIVRKIQQNLIRTWTPGTIEFYGNPALDIGDIVEVGGGINGKNHTYFLIGADSWQFRSKQTLIAPGPAETGSLSSVGGSSSGSSASSVTNVTVTKSLNTVILEKRLGELYEGEKTAAEGGFSCKSATNCFLSFASVFLAEKNCTAAIKVYLNGIAQEFRTKLTLHAGEFGTASFTIPLSVSAGTHAVSVTASGLAELQDVSAFVFGQEITEKAPQYTSGEDYRYTVNNGISTVTAYLGTSLHPEIPSTLGGGATTIIDKKAFTESEITGVWIPEGVTEIR